MSHGCHSDKIHPMLCRADETSAIIIITTIRIIVIIVIIVISRFGRVGWRS